MQQAQSQPAMLPCTLFQKKKKKERKKEKVKQKLIWVVSLSRFKRIFILRFVIVHKKTNKEKKKKVWRTVCFRHDSFRRCCQHIQPIRLHCLTQIHGGGLKPGYWHLNTGATVWCQRPISTRLCTSFSFFAMTSLLFTQKVLKTLYYDWLKFPSEFPPLRLSRGRVSFYWWEVRWSEPEDWGGGRGGQRDGERVEGPRSLI